MKRWGWGIAALLALLAAVGGYLAYRDYRGVQELGQEVYFELEYDGVPPPPGLADDPLFATLPPPPPERPLSLGRYRAPEPAAGSEPEAEAAPVPTPEPAAPQSVAPARETDAPGTSEPPPAPESPAPAPAATDADGPTPASEVSTGSPQPAAPPEPARAVQTPPVPPVVQTAPVAVQTQTTVQTPATAPVSPTAPPEPAPALEVEPVRTRPAATPAPVPATAPVLGARPVSEPPPTPPVRPASVSATPARQEATPVAAQPAPAAATPPAAALPAIRPTPPSATPAAAPAPRYVGGTFLERIRTPARIRVLLIGTDQEVLGRGRADVLLLLTFDPVDRALRLLSIPRDTLITLPGRGAVKINAAYALGGPSLQTEAVERLLGLATDKYIEISLAGFREAVDVLGGVTVNPEFAFSLDGTNFTPGATRLGGAEALAYTRMRRGDPEGDFGRNRRQQEVVRSLMGAVSDLPPAQLLPLIGQLSEHLRTNFSPSEVVELRRVHDYANSRQQSVAMQGRGEVRGGVWYFIVGDRERQRLHLLLR